VVKGGERIKRVRERRSQRGGRRPRVFVQRRDESYRHHMHNVTCDHWLSDIGQLITVQVELVKDSGLLESFVS